MANKIAKRLVWAVEMLALHPADRVLEIGCGHGLAVFLVCDKLGRGRMVAIDRSPAMVELARRRNRGHVASGKAVIQAVALEEADFGEARFDKAFAVNVSVFWTRPAATLPVVKRLLAPGGALFLVFQPPGWSEVGAIQGFADRLIGLLRDYGFSGGEAAIGDLKPVPAVCVKAEA
jgi:SAM-dependent methyltransferase